MVRISDCEKEKETGNRERNGQDGKGVLNGNIQFQGEIMVEEFYERGFRAR